MIVSNPMPRKSSSVITLRCPTCNELLSQFASEPVLEWRCPAGHAFRGVRTLIAAMQAAGWESRLERW